MRLARWYLTLVLALSALAPWFAPRDPLDVDPVNALQPPSVAAPLGTDHLGRDVLSRAWHGGRVTLPVALAAAGLALSLGVGLALVGEGHPILRWASRWLVEALLAFPPLLLALVLLTLLGRGWWSLSVAVGLSQVAAVARVMGAALRSARVAGYVTAAQALGAGPARVVVGHVWPGTWPTLRAQVGVRIAYCLLGVTSLSFLGLGGAPGTPEWGAMLAEARAYFQVAPWLGWLPGALILGVVLAVNRLTR